MLGLKKKFLAGRLFSLLGLFPLGIFVVVHLYHQLYSLQGELTYNQKLFQTRSLPLIVPFLVLAIWIPIAYHGLYGLFVMKKARPQLFQYRYFGNLKYVLQRLSGLGLLLFIPAHLFKTRIEPFLEEEILDFRHMSEAFQEPLTLGIYLLGVLGVAYHLANGFWQFCIAWGGVSSTQGMKRLEGLSILVFVTLLAMGYGAIWGFYRAAP